MNNSFLIYKSFEPSGEHPGYWNDELEEWVEEIEEATTFPILIMTVPLPPGATHIVEVNQINDIVAYYSRILPVEVV